MVGKRKNGKGEDGGDTAGKTARKSAYQHIDTVSKVKLQNASSERVSQQVCGVTKRVLFANRLQVVELRRLVQHVKGHPHVVGVEIQLWTSCWLIDSPYVSSSQA